jgi:aerobic carbon-monoxide dehydrogenase large subunit
VIPVSATIANAVSDALGKPIDRMPLSPLDLFELTKALGHQSPNPAR